MGFSSGLAAVDRYLEEDYEKVRGMSSRFAATICAHVLRRQSEWGVRGHLAEIGAFEGRFFIPLALALRPDERGLGVDMFEWPNPGVLDLFKGHLARAGLSEAQVRVLKEDSAALTPARIAALLGGPVRLFHIDGDHSREALTRELDLAYEVMHEDGVVVLDDMLHPGYPLLVVAVHEWLARRPDMRVVCVIDREDIIAATKFVLCRTSAYERYEQDLMASFPAQHWVLGSEWERWFCVVLTQRPRLAIVD